MTDAEKAIEIAYKCFPNKFEHETFGCPNCEAGKVESACLKMAEWKEQQMIDKAVEWLKKNVSYIHPRKGTEECVVNLNAFIEAMKGE